MIFLFFQTWLWILFAGLLGLFIGWLIWGRDVSAAVAVHEATDTGGIMEEWRPTGLADADGEADNLKRIKGIGPVIETTLNQLGIYHFHQIGAFTDENIKWVDNHMAFPGRIRREDWVNQASRLAGQSKTEPSD